MNLKLEIEFSKADILQEVDALKKQIDDMRPLPEDVEGKVMQKLRLDWNYNSNAIEGNKLSYGETVAFLMEGITAKGKPLKDHLDIRGHNEAILFLTSLVKEARSISEADIRSLHEMILVEPYNSPAQTPEGLPTTKKITLGEYKKSKNHVKTATGELHYYATPEETPAKMQELMEWYSETINNKDIHPVVAAALFHHKFVEIHPFDDGNGRLSRILMNLILMQKNFPPVIVKMDDRQNYYSLLSRADNGDNWPFIEYIAERLQSSLSIFLKAANGGDIDEDEDIDKEIALLKMQLTGGITAKEKKSKDSIEKAFSEFILPMFIKVAEKSMGFKDFFFQNAIFLNFQFLENGIAKTTDVAVSENYLGNYKNFLLKQHLSISLNIHYTEYKNPDNIFNLQISLRPIFEEYYYKILLGNEVITSRLYHQKLSSTDESKIIKAFINDFKKQLDEKQKSSKS